MLVKVSSNTASPGFHNQTRSCVRGISLHYGNKNSVLIRPVLVLGLSSKKQLGVFLLPSVRDVIPTQGYGLVVIA